MEVGLEVKESMEASTLQYLETRLAQIGLTECDAAAELVRS